VIGTRSLGISMGLVLSAAMPAPGNELAINVRLRNDAAASIPQESVMEAQERVASLYATHGVRVVWVAAHPHITLVLLSAEGGRRMHQISDAMGYAPASGSDGGRIAYVLVDRVDRISRGYAAEHAVVLAAALAHELGHLLLPPKPHTPTGVMRSEWNQSDFRKLREGRLHFTGPQAEQLREFVDKLWR